MRCYRHLDSPFEVFLGLGPVDWLIILVVGVGLLMVNAFLAAGATTGLFFFFKRTKQGKPKGHLFYLFYKSGLATLAPEPLRPPYLVRPPMPGGSRVLRFSGVPGNDDDVFEEVRFWKSPSATFFNSSRAFDVSAFSISRCCF